METASERRDPFLARVPVDDVMVDLVPEGYDESFPADAIDVGLGGLAMRSSILPDVGSRLRCRFASPHGGSIAADAEVVWAADSGPNVGEFGLRFTDLAVEDAERIAHLVDAWHRALGAPSVANDVCERVSLKLDGVGPVVETDLMRRDADAMVLEQALPFLTIGKGVDAEGRRGTLESVNLRLDGDLPRLMLTVSFTARDESGEPRSNARSSDAEEVDKKVTTTLEDEATHAAHAVSPDTLPEAVVVERPASRPASTSPRLIRQVLVEASSEAEECGIEGKGAFQAKSACESNGDSSPRRDAEESDGERAGSNESRDLLSAYGSRAEASFSARDEDPLLAELGDPNAGLRQLLTRVAPLWARVRGWFIKLWIVASPRLRSWSAFARTGLRRGGSMMRALGATLSKRVLASLPGRDAQRSTTRRQPTRPRSTQLPRQRATRGRMSEGRLIERDADPRAVGRPSRWLARGVLLLSVFALGTLVARLAFGSDDGAEAVGSSKAAEPKASPDDAYAADAYAEPTSPSELPPPADPEIGDEGALAAGPMAEPSFPEVRAAEVRALSFGEARVVGGREFRLNLSVPPTGLRGEPMSNGFKVTLQGSNALDGARTIGAQHPRVARASIVNEGENAVLTVRFAPGDNPAYRVHARGAGLFVTIGR